MTSNCKVLDHFLFIQWSSFAVEFMKFCLIDTAWIAAVDLGRNNAHVTYLVSVDTS